MSSRLYKKQTKFRILSAIVYSVDLLYFRFDIQLKLATKCGKLKINVTFGFNKTYYWSVDCR